MQNRRELPNPDLDTEQHLRILEAASAALGYEAQGSIKVGDIIKQSIFREGSRIRNNQVSKAISFLADLDLVRYDDANNAYSLSESAVEWARARRDGEANAAKTRMQNVLSSTWLGKAMAKARPSDPAGLRKAVLVEAGLDETNDDPTTMQQVRILVELAGRFELSEAIDVDEYYAETVPALSEEDGDMPADVPQRAEPEPPASPPEPAHPPPSAQQAHYAPAMIQTPPVPLSSEPGSGTSLTVSVDEDNVNVQIHAALQLPLSDAERRLDLLLKALLNQILAQLPDEH